MISSPLADLFVRTLRLIAPRLSPLCWLGVAVCGSPQLATAEESTPARQLSFKRDVRPILSNHCFACHGPNEAHREADLRLDIASDFDLEAALERISSDDPDMIMPPPSLNKPLDAEQIDTLKRWLAADAPYEQHWAFIAPREAQPPTLSVQLATADSHNGLSDESAIDVRAWSAQPIDRFVLASLNEAGLSPSPIADRRTLIRRVTLDLTGLPPTRAEVQAFLSDTSPEAYPRLVERLLNEPAYGEHMARYWLDLVRFADTNGLHHDHYREVTPYRDWVIRAFDENLPFDQFITDQLAGDLFPAPTTDQLIASGFNRLHLIIDVGTALPEESFFRNVVDQVSAVGTAFMGLTLQCAVCHDHKYDPITQRDFYSMSAFFNNFDGEPETGGRGTVDFKRGLQSPYLELPSAEQSAALAQFDTQLAGLEPRLAALLERRQAAQVELDKYKIETPQTSEAAPSEVADNPPANAQATLPAETADKLAAIERTLAEQSLAAFDQAVAAMTAERDALKSGREALLMEIPATLVMKERAEIRPAYVMIRGEYDKPGAEVARNTPSFLPPLNPTGPVPTRMDLAKWLTARDNPLTARVAVNRFWQQLFGVGLVKTSEDFGSQGETPRLPELLDFLSLQFIDSGWDVKAMMRSIALSQTYQQTSHASRESYAADPRNRQLARGSRFRLDAEVVRDQLLAISGLLNRELFGKSVKPPQPNGLWETVVMPSSYPNSYKPDAGDKIFRRSLYTFWKRAIPPPQMTIFDAPTRESCIARRERTNTPLQALLLMNEEQYFAAARHWAESLLVDRELSDQQRIVEAYEMATAQLPDPHTLEQLQQGLIAFRDLYRSDIAATQAMLGTAADDSEQPSELAAWTMFVHSLLNLDITRTRE